MRVISKSIGQTKRIAAAVTKRALADKNRRHATVIALEGELGAGKTTFVQGFAASLGVRSAVRSPTFLLMRSYKLKVPIAKQSRILDKVGTISYQLLYHIDCYRITGAKELLSLGLKAILNDPMNIVLIEWAERIRSALPRRRFDIHIDHLDEHSRRLTITQRR